MEPLDTLMPLAIFVAACVLARFTVKTSGRTFLERRTGGRCEHELLEVAESVVQRNVQDGIRVFVWNLVCFRQGVDEQSCAHQHTVLSVPAV